MDVPPHGTSMDIELTACMQGDVAAWNQFCHETAGVIQAAIRRTAGAQLQDPALPDIEDLVQAVYLRLVKHDFRLLKSFDPAKASLVTWLTLVARSTTIDALRRRKQPTVAIQDSDAAASRTEHGHSEPVDLEQVAPLHLLTERQRLVLALLFKDEMTVPEAAAVLGVEEQTIRSTKHKALEHLRKAMQAGENHDEG
jgi:RNA polymerase sigma factor (sigma-70 family)